MTKLSRRNVDGKGGSELEFPNHKNINGTFKKPPIQDVEKPKNLSKIL